MAKAAATKAKTKKPGVKKVTAFEKILGTVVTVASVLNAMIGTVSKTRAIAKTDVAIVNITSDPRNGAVAIIGSEKKKYRVVSERLAFVSDLLPLDEATTLFNEYVNNSQRN